MVWHDLRYAVRALVIRPGFTSVAVVTLALGIGANTAIFTVVDAVLLRPLPYPDADRLVRVRGLDLGTRQPGNLSPMDFLDLQNRARAFDGLAAYNNYAAATLTGAGEAERLAGTRVTARFFSVLRVVPRLGRDFRGDDDVPGASPVVILSDGFWRRRFGGDPSIVGRTIQLSSVAYEVVGVMPAGFEHPFPDDARQPDVYVTFRIDPKENIRTGHFLQAIGRMRAGASLASAEVDLVAVASDLERTYPKSNTGRSVAIQPMIDSMIGNVRPALLVLAGTVAFVLLIACANLANLLLARSLSRQKEIAVRQALGATRMQLVRQFLAESVVLAFAGGAVGLLFAQWTTRAILALGAARIPRGAAIHIDPRVLVFTVALSLITGLLFGVGPAVYATRVDQGGALKEGGRSGEGPMRLGAQQALIVSETALALVLLVGAGLLAKSLWRLASVDPGFRADHVLTLQTSLPIARYPEGDEIPFYQRLEERVGALPGVREVGAVNILPLGGNYSCDSFDIEGRPPFPPGQEPCAEDRSITPGYFAAMGIPLLSGRTFTRQDVEGARPVVIINERMASTFWPAKNPVGSQLVRNGVAREIVAVVGGVRHFALDRDVTNEMYTPHAQQPSFHTMTLVVRASTDPASLMPSIRAELSTMDRDVPISSVATMEQMVDVSTTEPRFRTMLVGAFAALAMVLSVVGVAGVISYTVGRRMHEIGVRVALGATGPQVVRLLVAQGMRPTALGIVIGLAGSFALTRVLAGLLYGVTATDIGAFVVAAAGLAAASLAASYMPARRATAVDPMIALRAE
jgi:putative ABC transport system permease protein